MWLEKIYFWITSPPTWSLFTLASVMFGRGGGTFLPMFSLLLSLENSVCVLILKQTWLNSGNSRSSSPECNMFGNGCLIELTNCKNIARIQVGKKFNLILMSLNCAPLPLYADMQPFMRAVPHSASPLHPSVFLPMVKPENLASFPWLPVINLKQK